jgi:ABC-type sugar transport system permease subunit
VISPQSTGELPTKPPQPPIARRRAVFGAIWAALFASAIIAIAGAAHYISLVNKGQLALVQSPARSYAAALARRIEKDPTPPAAQRSLLQLASVAQHVQRLTVVVEPASTKYRFLRKRRFLADRDAKRVGQVLDKRSVADKALYDVASQVRRDKRAQLKLDSEPGKPLRVRAAAPVMRDGKHWATVVVITAPPASPPPLPAWPLGAAALAMLLLAAIAGFSVPRHRHVLVMLLSVAVSALSWWWISSLAASYSSEVATRLTSLDSALSTSLAGSGPSFCGPGLGFFLAVAAALGVGVLGLLGVGARIAGGLREHRLAYTLLLPTGLGMLILVLVPFSYGLGLGFFNHQHGQYTYVGLENFLEILSGGGRPLSHPLNFYFTLGVTILWTAVNVVLHVAIGLGLALLLKDPLLRFKGIYRALLILPWAMPNYITALIWKGMFHYQYGAVNHVLESLGLEKVSWFSSFSTAFIANVVTNTWLGFPFMMVVALGALQSIPGDVYEAAAVDGASKTQVFLRITLPLLRPALYPAIVLGSIWTFNMFNIIYLVSAGAPNGSTDILITEAYRWAFERGDKYGLAAAYALIIFLILWVYSKVANRLARASEDI